MTINIIGKEKKPLTLNETYQTWQKLKSRYMDAIVVLRKEEEYFAFDLDAEIVSVFTGIKRQPIWKDKTICIIPYYQTDTLLSLLVQAGYRVAICEPIFFNL